jgi:hypothetical protein
VGNLCLPKAARLDKLARKAHLLGPQDDTGAHARSGGKRFVIQDGHRWQAIDHECYVRRKKITSTKWYNQIHYFRIDCKDGPIRYATYWVLGSLILGGVIRPHQKISGLAKMLGVSRASVRHALALLRKEGIAVVRNVVDDGGRKIGVMISECED